MNPDVAAEVDDMVVADEDIAAGADEASRLRKAVTSVVVVTMLTTFQPSADFWLRVAARAAGSFADALAVENSCISRRVSRT